MDFELEYNIRDNFDVMHDSEHNRFGNDRSSKSIKVHIGGKSYNIRTYTHAEKLEEKVVEIVHDKLGERTFLNKNDLKRVAKRINQADSSGKSSFSLTSSFFSRNRSNYNDNQELKKLVGEIKDQLNTIEEDEYSQYAQEIKSGKISLLDYFGSIENVDINKLLKLAPYLEHVDLSDIEDEIEGQVEGGIGRFLRKCKKMTDLKVQRPLENLKISSESLTSIVAPNASKLDCSFCRTLTSIDAPNVSELVCDGCNALTSIVAPNATELDCSGCTALTSIDAPNARKLNYSFCRALTSIDAPNATELVCSGCTALTSIVAPNASKLDCYGCTALTSIVAPNASKLDCSGCTTLTSIVAPNASKLDCYNCTALTSIDAPNATELGCYNCTVLTSIEAPKTLSLICSSCTALTSIVVPNATKLDCSGCTALTSIVVPNATKLICSGCTALTSIDAPRLLYLLSTNCWSLQELRGPRLSTIQIRKEIMIETPEEYLSKLIPYFLVNKQWPSVEFIETDGRKSPGIDASGLRKDAQTTLVQALFLKENPP